MRSGSRWRRSRPPWTISPTRTPWSTTCRRDPSRRIEPVSDPVVTTLSGLPAERDPGLEQIFLTISRLSWWLLFWLHGLVQNIIEGACCQCAWTLIAFVHFWTEEEFEPLTFRATEYCASPHKENSFSSRNRNWKLMAYLPVGRDLYLLLLDPLSSALLH